MSDDADESNEIQVAIEWPWPWTADIHEARRCFILDKLASPEIQGALLVENMAAVEAWLKTGEVPAKGKKLNLGVVK